MPTALLQGCSNCSSLKSLLEQIDSSLCKRITNKWYQEIYAADTYFNKDVYRDLMRYKRILERRVVEGTYPCKDIDSQDIISKITLLINK